MAPVFPVEFLFSTKELSAPSPQKNQATKGNYANSPDLVFSKSLAKSGQTYFLASSQQTTNE